MVTMRVALAVLAFGGLFACSSSAESPPPATDTNAPSLVVMSFNIFRNGERGIDAVVQAIRGANADIVGLQECNASAAATIASSLGFREVHDPNGHAIVSRFPISVIGSTRDVWGGLGATVDVGRPTLERVHVFDVHLFWDEYGPYYLSEGKTSSFILERESARRMPGLEELFALMQPALATNEPALLLGDFNAPSHLDYADFAWPESLACEARGFADSYRELHPNNRTYPGAFAFDEPGITWTPLVSEEPHGAFDRIDFVHYLTGRRLKPESSMELDGRNSVSPWPSDHRAVLTTFAIE